MSKAKWFQYDGVSNKARAARPEPTSRPPMTFRKRLALGILLVDLAIVFVFALWPLHHAYSYAPVFNSPGGSGTTACGSALRPSDAGGDCKSVVGHRRALLLGLGAGGFVVALFGLQLAFVGRDGGDDSEKDDAPTDGGNDDPPEMSAETLDKLERLGRLRASGVLTDDEFASEKAKLLASL